MVGDTETAGPAAEHAGSIAGDAESECPARGGERPDAGDRFWTSFGFASALLDRGRDGIFAFDREGRLTYWNRSLERIYGLSRERALGKRALDVLPVLRESGDERFLGDALLGRHASVAVRPHRDSETGLVRYYETTYAPVRSEDGRIVGGTAVVHDVTEAKRSDHESMESENRFRIMANSAPVLLWMAGRDARCEFFNRQWLEFTGRSLDEELGDGWVESVHAEDFQRCVDGYMDAFRARRPFRLEYRLRRHDGQYWWILDQGAPRYSPGGEFAGFIGSCIDVTDFKDAEDRLRAAKAELEARSAELRRSNADLEQFAYAASHDLKEPLRTVASYAQLLKRRYERKLDPDADEFIGYLVDGATRMQALIEGVLEISSMGSQEHEPARVDSDAVFENTVAALRTTIERSGATVTHDPLPQLVADPVQLGQLFQNLLSNAIVFRRDEPPRVHVSAARKEEFWLFSVRDEGIGLDPRYASKIFNLFSRLNPREAYPGTGMGLAVCKKVVERHGGRIWVESEPGRGSVFRFTLPA